MLHFLKYLFEQCAQYLSFCIIVKNNEILGGPIHYLYHNMMRCDYCFVFKKLHQVL